MEWGLRATVATVLISAAAAGVPGAVDGGSRARGDKTGGGSFKIGGAHVPAKHGPDGSPLFNKHTQDAGVRQKAMHPGGRAHGDAPGMVLPFEGERMKLPPNQRRSHSKKRMGWDGKCLGKDGQNPLKFTTVFGNDHLGDEAHADVDMAHKTARNICTDLCHHYHQWCLAIELKAPVPAGKGQHHPPECSLISDEDTFDSAGGVMHDARWGGRQHFFEDTHVYLTYCGGAGCQFQRGSEWNGGKINSEKHFACYPAIGFDAYDEAKLLDQHGKKLKPGYHHTGKTHGGRKGMGEGVEADEKAEKVEHDQNIEDLKQMRQDLDAKLARLEKLEGDRASRNRPDTSAE